MGLSLLATLLLAAAQAEPCAPMQGVPVPEGIGAATAAIQDANPSLETDDFRVIDGKVRELGQLHGSSRVLVVLDIDNTILKMPQDIASEHWYEWQAEKIAKNDPADRVASSMTELIQMGGLLLEATRMLPTQKETPEIIRKLQGDGFTSMVLTSRSPAGKGATLRELRRNGFDLAQPPLAEQAENTIPGEFTIGASRPLEFSRGVFLTAGHDKGEMLKAILAKTGRSFDAIVFVDNKESHLVKVRNAFRDRDETVLTVRYTREDAQLKAFEKKDKRPIARQWRDFSKALKATFPQE